MDIMVAWAETPVANHELLLSCFDFIAKMMAGGVFHKQGSDGSKQGDGGSEQGSGGAQLPGRRGFYGLPRGSLRGRIPDYGPRECDFYENILPRLRLLLTLHSEYKAYSKGCLGSCPG